MKRRFRSKLHRCVCFVFGRFFNTDGDKYRTVQDEIVDDRNQLFRGKRFKLVIRGGHNLYKVIEMFRHKDIECITFDEYKLDRPSDDMAKYRNVS